MVDQVVFETEQLDRYGALLAAAPARLGALAVGTVSKTMLEAKRAQQLDFMGSSNRAFRSIARHVHYTDPQVSGSSVSSRLGVQKSGSGRLANIAVFGTYRGGGTHMHPVYYLNQELPRARSAFAEAIAKALKS